MCFAIIEVKLKNEKERTLKRIESREQLTKDLTQLERMGTVESVVVFYNHHTHRLVESWQDEMFHEKTPPDAGELNAATLNRAFNNDPKVTA